MEPMSKNMAVCGLVFKTTARRHLFLADISLLQASGSVATRTLVKTCLPGSFRARTSLHPCSEMFVKTYSVYLTGCVILQQYLQIRLDSGVSFQRKLAIDFNVKKIYSS